MPKHRHRLRLVRIGDDLGTLFENRVRILGDQPDELLSAFLDEVWTLHAANADKIRLLLRHRPGKSGVVGRNRAIGILSDDDVSLLGTQDMHRRTRYRWHGYARRRRT